MKEVEVTTKIIVKEDGEILAEVKNATEEGDQQLEQSAEQAAGEDERDALVSDLANCCEYLEESEVIKIRLIVSKAQKRKEMDGA